MLNKRLIAVVTVRDGLAVQSFGYSRYLPIGKPEHLVENFDRWGADEILVHVIDRSIRNLGPDFELLTRLAALGLRTPLIYGGGIKTVEDARQVIRSGADRLSIDHLLYSSPDKVCKISSELGAQALIASLPLGFSPHPVRYCYISNSFHSFDFVLSFHLGGLS